MWESSGGADSQLVLNCFEIAFHLNHAEAAKGPGAANRDSRMQRKHIWFAFGPNIRELLADVWFTHVRLRHSQAGSDSATLATLAWHRLATLCSLLRKAPKSRANSIQGRGGHLRTRTFQRMKMNEVKTATTGKQSKTKKSGKNVKKMCQYAVGQDLTWSSLLTRWTLGHFGSIACITLTWRRPELEKPILQLGLATQYRFKSTIQKIWSCSVKISEDPKLSQRKDFEIFE